MPTNYYCAKCSKWFKGEMRHEACPGCNEIITVADEKYMVDEIMADEKRKQFNEEYLKNNPQMADANILEALMIKIYRDIHFIKNVVLSGVVLTVAGVLIALVYLWV